jgi:nucleoid-associated protein YgaU
MVAKSARFLAPIALAALAVGVYMIVHAALAPRDPAARRTSTAIVHTSRSARRRRHQPTFYTVKAGDTLSTISDKTGVSLPRLTQLNPSVSSPPYSLQTGQRLRLRQRR